MEMTFNILFPSYQDLHWKSPAKSHSRGNAAKGREYVRMRTRRNCGSIRGRKNNKQNGTTHTLAMGPVNVVNLKNEERMEGCAEFPFTCRHNS